MSVRFIAYLAICVAIGWIIYACNDKSTDFEHTDLFQITGLINDSDVGKSIFPQYWIDTTSRANLYTKAHSAVGTINPSDYWVEVVKHSRTILDVAESCKTDQCNQDNSCAQIELIDAGCAHARIASIRDSVICKYHIVNSLDSSIILKQVNFVDVYTALVAKLNNVQQYQGWAIYAVGRQREGLRFAGNFLDSTSVTVVSSDGAPFTSYPMRRIQYYRTSQLPQFHSGDPIDVHINLGDRHSDESLVDAYIHYNVDGVVRREFIGVTSQNTFDYAIYESSNASTGTFSQVVVELFRDTALRNDSPTSFNNLITVITYKKIS